jgi:dGTPase
MGPVTAPLHAYSADEVARLLPEQGTSAHRTAFQRDRARVLHSAALRRLGATTQVMVPLEQDFPRTRLTHSLEVAQIGRELGASLGCDPDLVETAALAHDLGHPPFGHNGEQALDEVAGECGGFEGNAQTFRVLSRLEAKAIDADGRSVGLNLTRAALDASTKYPWPRREGTRKFGVYEDDRRTFDWMRAGAEADRRCLEAQVMDWADDVAYSVHDLEDGLHGGLINLAVLSDRGERAALFDLCLARYAAQATFADLDAALDRLLALPLWPTSFDGSHEAQVALKRLTSALIGRFCTAADAATREQFGDGPLARYGADLLIPAGTRWECAVLKAVTARYVMERPGAEVALAEQQAVVKELVAAVRAGAPATLSPAFLPAYAAATDDAARLRVVIDQVASLTDPSALVWHTRLCR